MSFSGTAVFEDKTRQMTASPFFVTSATDAYLSRKAIRSSILVCLVNRYPTPSTYTRYSRSVFARVIAFTIPKWYSISLLSESSSIRRSMLSNSCVSSEKFSFTGESLSIPAGISKSGDTLYVLPSMVINSSKSFCEFSLAKTGKPVNTKIIRASSIFLHISITDLFR